MLFTFTVPLNAGDDAVLALNAGDDAVLALNAGIATIVPDSQPSITAAASFAVNPA